MKAFVNIRMLVDSLAGRSVPSFGNCNLDLSMQEREKKKIKMATAMYLEHYLDSKTANTALMQRVEILHSH